MSKMKHLLRKLHIGGGGINDHHRLASSESTRPSPSLSPTPSQSPSASESSSSAHGGGMGRIGAVESSSSSVGDRTVTDGGGVVAAAEVDFNLLEEEFQVQLALAISASDPDSREDPETAQIDAAKRISLGGSASVTDNQALVKFLSPRYWVRYLSISNLYRSFLQIVCEFERIRFFFFKFHSCLDLFAFKIESSFP